MKRMTSWLKARFARPTLVDAEIQAQSQETGQNVLMPDIYADAHDATQPLLKIIDPTSPDIDASAGFNPYDTVVLHQKSGAK